MTEAEWLACTDPEMLLHFLGRKPARKLKLFGCACLRRIWGVLPDRRCRRLVEVAERDADGRARAGTVADALRAVKARGLREAAGRYGLFAFWALRDWVGRRGPMVWGHVKAAEVARWSAGAVAHQAYHAAEDRGTGLAVRSPVWVAAEFAERTAQCDLLRDVFNPFRPAGRSCQVPEGVSPAPWRRTTRTPPPGSARCGS
jgi:hypothetical protein